MPNRFIVTATAIAFVCIATIYGPRFIRARTIPAAAPCVNTMRQLDGAKQQWVLENRKDTNAVPTLDDLRPYVKLTSSGQVPNCPSGGTYTLGRVEDRVKCSIGGPSHTLP